MPSPENTQPQPTPEEQAARDERRQELIENLSIFMMISRVPACIASCVTGEGKTQTIALTVEEEMFPLLLDAMEQFVTKARAGQLGSFGRALNG